MRPSREVWRQDRLIKERVHDAYKLRRKLPEPTVCPECGAVYSNGRWQWIPKPPDAREETCPACNRVRDKMPAGFLFLGGPFFDENRVEILNLVLNRGKQAAKQRPLKRIIDVVDQDDGVLVTTTDMALARTIGKAVHNAYQGDLEFQHVKEQSELEVRWRR